MRTLNPPLPITVTDKAANLRTGRTETWGAAADGWRFVRTEEPGTPWYAEATDLHLAQAFGSLRDARTAAANGLHSELIGMARRTGLATGRLISHHAAPMYACACGGLLVDLRHDTSGEDLRHVDGCTECTTAWQPGDTDPDRGEPARPGCCTPCDNADRHVVCGNPRPYTCARCDTGYVPLAIACHCGLEDCCGSCCEPDYEPGYDDRN
jgi:hypothetical protein